MRILSQRLSSIEPAETMEMAKYAAALRQQGHDVISLSQGEPDFPTPAYICDAAIQAIQSGLTRYTEAAGIAELRETIATKMQQEYGLTYSAQQVTVTAGAKQAIFNAFFATLDEGDEVIVPAPCWVSYPEIVKLTGGHPIVVDCPRSDGFKLTAQNLEAVITPRTKWLMLNSPSNPTGAVYSVDELKALGDVLRRHPHVWVLTDEIYERLYYGDQPLQNFLQVLPDLQERTLVINGVSKIYCMTGWRLGYAVGPVELIQSMTLVQGQSTNNANTIAQYAAITAIRGDQSQTQVFRDEFMKRRDFIVNAFNSIPYLSVDSPEGAFYTYVSCQDALGLRTPEGHVLETDRDFVRYLLDDAQVAVVSGTGFMHPGYFRASYAAAMSQLEQAAIRIQSAMERLRS